MLPTTIGSLPQSSAVEAVDLILRFTPEIPAWPQLPGLGFSHSMCVQCAHDLPGVIADDVAKVVRMDLSDVPAKELEEYYSRLLAGDPERFAADETHFPGLFELSRRREALRKALAVKGQLAGPVSIGLQTLTREKTPILYQGTEMELLLKSLRLKAQWHENFLKRCNPNTILFLDEPSMSLVGSPCVTIQKDIAVSYIDEVLSGLSGIKGVHCCGNTDWGALLETRTDVLSFDAYDWVHTLALYPSHVESFLSRGGKLAWGIIPTIDERIERENIESLMTRFQEGLTQLTSKGIDLDVILTSSFITPACGLGLTSAADALKALGFTKELSRRLRKEYNLEG